MTIHVRREGARALFERLDRELREDEVLADKQCVQMILDKAAKEHAANSRKRFDAQTEFRRRLVYPKMDDVIADWCRRREIRADPYNVFRYGGKERGPTQHDTAVGPSLGQIGRFLDRLAEEVPEIPDCRRRVLKSPTKAIAPAFRLQHPLPFGAAGEVGYAADRGQLERGIYLTAMQAGTGGDPSRGWRYDCGLFICYMERRPREIIDEALLSAWEDVRERVWHSARTWVILL